MRRRTNKSSKVPNVKLRPAQEGATTRLRRQESSVLAEDSQLGSDDTVVVDLCPRPFKGFVLCATGVVDKPTLFKQALELGATSTSAFTDRVTHLVAEDHHGAKYNCAVERKIPILRTSWIAESYQIWLRGDDVELHESIEKHRLPVFSGVALCISGITDVAHQTQIAKLLTRNGGQYFKKLERPIRVTHLLCSGDEETEKMRYAEKFTSRGEANVHMVWEEWFWDCLEFGGRFDEQRYYVRHPRPERKLLPEADGSFLPSSMPSSLSREVDSSRQPEPAQEEEGEVELASVKRLPAATLQLWGNLLGRRGYEVSGGEIIKSPSKVAKPTIPPEPPASPKDGNNESLISKFRRSNSFAPVRPDSSNSTLPQPFRRTRPTSAVAGDVLGAPMESDLPATQNYAECSNSAVATTSGIFASLKFVALGEAKSPSVRAAVESNGGRLMPESSEDEIDFIIVRLVSGSKLYQQEPDETRQVKYRTECWLERCVFEDRVCPVDDHITFAPLNVQFPISGAEEVSLSFSGLDQAEATWTTRLLRALGINLERYFSRKTTHLLCPSASGPKFDKAQEWGIPVVTMDWLATIVTSGTVLSNSTSSNIAKRHDIHQSKTKDLMSTGTDVKGKGKAAETVDTVALDHDGMVSEGKGDDHHSLRPPKIITNIPGRELVDPHTLTPLINPLVTIPLTQVDAVPTQLPPPTPSPARSHSERTHFGRPTGALAGPSKYPVVITPPRTRSVPTIPTSHHHDSLHVAFSVPTTPSSNRRLTQRDIELERKRARIPSSKSPSPLKVPRQSQNRLPTESPTRIPRDIAKALEDNITTLLGKRPSSEFESVPNAAPPGKRQRPHRPTRARSLKVLATQTQEAPPHSVAAEDDSMSSFEPVDELNLLDSRSTEDSIRVTYEDPKQREETQRLMSLLNVGPRSASGDSFDGKGRSSLRTRKSTRIAGF